MAPRIRGCPGHGMKECASVFTGLVEVLGRVEKVVRENAGQRLTLAWPGLTSLLEIGESVAVNGCCLTVVASDGEQFEVQAGRAFRPGTHRRHGRAARAAVGR